MRYVKILLLILIPVAFCIAASPINPLVGTWAGEGRGDAHPPGTTIYPWQYWKGEIPNDGRTFRGEWRDEKRNHGEFKGEIVWISLTTATAKGEWTWDNPHGVSVVAGKFKMTFYVYDKKCKGEWTSIYPSSSAVGAMWGRKVD